MHEDSIISPLPQRGAIISLWSSISVTLKIKTKAKVKAQRKDKRNQELDLSPFPDLTFFPSS